MQISSFLVTNGGPHPADKWAELSADTIVDTLLVDANLDNNSPEALSARNAKRALRHVLFDILNDHHDGVQLKEQEGLPKKKADAALHADHEQTPLDPRPYIDSVMPDIRQAFSKTPWAEHLAKPEVIALVEQIVGQHTTDVMHIERRWHHDRLAAKGA